MDEIVHEWIEKQARELDIEGPVVEFGSRRVPGQEHFDDLRVLFPGLEYVGCDITRGEGVDVIDNVEISGFEPGRAGTVVCLDTLEHVAHPWVAVAEVYRILRPGGLFLVNIPFNFLLHAHPGDYWRATAEGLGLLLREAGFEEVRLSDSGERRYSQEDVVAPSPVVGDVAHPYFVFAVARKPETCWNPLGSGVEASVPAPRTVDESWERPVVPIVVVVYHREEETLRMLEQLKEVTERYSLIIVDNGFDDRSSLQALAPEKYVRNEGNPGFIRAVNQGLELAEGEYVAVLHPDLLILDEGWLDHIVRFMERRRDAGLVGLAGRHSVGADGSLDHESIVISLKGYPAGMRPTWRFTEVAVIDGIGWVMRNSGFRLDEGYGLSHYYDLDLSMQYIDAGYRVYVAAVELWHHGFDTHAYEAPVQSSRTSEEYLGMIGGDDNAYYLEARERFRDKWAHILPVSRGFRDEAYGYHRVDELLQALEALREYAESLRLECEARGAELEKAARYVAEVEEDNRAKAAEMEKQVAIIRALESRISEARKRPEAPDG